MPKPFVVPFNDDRFDIHQDDGSFGVAFDLADEDFEPHPDDPTQLVPNASARKRIASYADGVRAAADAHTAKEQRRIDVLGRFDTFQSGLEMIGAFTGGALGLSTGIPSLGLTGPPAAIAAGGLGAAGGNATANFLGSLDPETRTAIASRGSFKDDAVMGPLAAGTIDLMFGTAVPVLGAAGVKAGRAATGVTRDAAAKLTQSQFAEQVFRRLGVAHLGRQELRQTISTVARLPLVGRPARAFLREGRRSAQQTVDDFLHIMSPRTTLSKAGVKLFRGYEKRHDAIRAPITRLYENVARDSVEIGMAVPLGGSGLDVVGSVVQAQNIPHLSRGTKQVMEEILPAATSDRRVQAVSVEKFMDWKRRLGNELRSLSRGKGSGVDSAFTPEERTQWEAINEIISQLDAGFANAVAPPGKEAQAEGVKKMFQEANRRWTALNGMLEAPSVRFLDKAIPTNPWGGTAPQSYEETLVTNTMDAIFMGRKNRQPAKALQEKIATQFIEQVKNPTAVPDLLKVVPKKVFRRGYRAYLDSVFQGATNITKDTSGREIISVDFENIRRTLGLVGTNANDAGFVQESRREFQQALTQAEIPLTVKQFDDLLQIAELSMRVDIPDAAAFVARKMMFQGLGLGLGAVTPGVITGAATGDQFGVAAGAAHLTSFATLFGLRQTSKMLTNPEFLQRLLNESTDLLFRPNGTAQMAARLGKFSLSLQEEQERERNGNIKQPVKLDAADVKGRLRNLRPGSHIQ